MEEQQEKTQGKKQDKKLWKIFWSTFYLSAFTFGGGYVIVSLMKKKFVDEYHWIEEEEMLDLVAIAQSAPGAIAVNGAIVIGYKLAGIAGILTAIAGTVIPPFLIISILSVGYQAFRNNQIISLMLEGMQAGVGAVIASVTYDMGAGIVKKKDALSYVLMVGAFTASCIFEVNVVYVILICGIVGVLRALIEKKITKKGSDEKLFLSFLQIGLFSFGGGYAAMPLIQEQVVTQHGWLTMTEFTDLITISQMTPGPIAINAATFVGSKIAGVPGSVAATCGCILPSCIIVTLIAWFYLRYKKMKMFQSVLESLRPAVVALIASAGIAILHTAFWADGIVQFAATKWSMVVIFGICLLLLRKTKLNPVVVMILAGVMNVAVRYAAG